MRIVRVTDGTNETSDDFINPAWGANFYIGCKNDGSQQLGGKIYQIAFFDKVLSDNQHNQGYLRKLNKIRTHLFG